MNKIDEFAAVEGKTILVVSRLLGFALFDFVSYAAGLTSLKYKDYIAITAIFGLIPNLTIQYVFRNIDFQSEKGVLIWIGSIVVAASVFGVLIKTYLDRIKKKKVSMSSNSP